MTDDLPRFTDAHNYLMSGKTLNLICDAIRRRTPLDGGCLVESLTPNGFTLAPAVGPADFPFKCPTAPGDHCKIVPGTVNSTEVTGGDDLSVGDNDVVWIHATLTLTKSDNDYVIGMTGVTYELEAGSEKPDDTTTDAYFSIAQYFDGELAQYAYSVLSHAVDDDGTGTGQPVYFWGSV